MLAESLTLTPNVALKQAIADYLDKRPSVKQLQQIALEHKSLELAIKLREEEFARHQTTPGNPAAAGFQLSVKRSPEEVRAWLKTLDLEECAPKLLDNGFVSTCL